MSHDKHYFEKSIIDFRNHLCIPVLSVNKQTIFGVISITHKLEFTASNIK